MVNKKNYQLLLLVTVSNVLCFGNTMHHDYATQLSTLHIAFDISMHHGFSLTAYKQMLANNPEKAKYLPVLKNIYERSNFLTKQEQQPSTEPLIPKIIHQIWLGSPLPDKYKQWQKSWLDLHPDWEYKLWTDADVHAFGLMNQDAFDKGRNYAEKANIARYEILYRLGGLYVDTDFECLKPFDFLHHFYEFYTGIVTINRHTIINNALIASRPGHPILKACIDDIHNKKNYGYKQLGLNGTIFFGYTILNACLHNNDLDVTTILIAPPTYFYALPLRGAARKKYIIDSSMAVHHWDASWNRPDFRTSSTTSGAASKT